jgi:hypothetical protein
MFQRDPNPPAEGRGGGFIFVLVVTLLLATLCEIFNWAPRP